MLKDLHQLALDAKAKRDLYINTEVELSDEFKSRFKAKLPDSTLHFNKATSVDYTSQGLAIVIPNQWFIIASFFTDFLEALFEFKATTNSFGFSDEKIRNFRGGSVDNDSLNKLDTGNLSPEEKKYLKMFLTDYSWWFGSKTIDRGDFFVSPILSLASVVHITQGYIATLTNVLREYPELVGLLHKSANESLTNENDVVDLKNEFAQWLVDNTNNNYFSNDVGKAIKGLINYQQLYEEEFKTKLFEVDFGKLGQELKTIKENVWNEDSNFWQFSKKQSTHQPRAILGTENYLRFLQEYQKPAEIVGEVIPGYNKIYFGAPGTGKSYAVAQLLKEHKVRESNIERVTFHPDYDYSSFIGGYKPVTETDEQGNESVKYKFVPQVFINIYEKAWRNPHQNYYLVIEEINRGNCAEIFGDIFQLLDRNPDYTITPSEDLFKYLNKRDEFLANESLHHGKLAMPDNLIILATMNTSDQSLYPMDSAFKRRWDWEYVPVKYPVNEADKSCPSFGYKIVLDDNHYINWIDFVKNINGHIMQNPSLGMDKCLGNFFLKPDVQGEISIDRVINKVMFYLWNDVFKDEENEIFSGYSYNDYFPIDTNGRAQLQALSDKYELVREIMIVTDHGAISVAGEETIS